MHIRDVSFDLFWEISAGEMRACSFVSPFFPHMRMNVCAYYTYVSTTPPRTTNIAVRNASTFVELWPGNDDGAAVLCLAFDNRSTRYVHAIDGDEQMKETPHCFSRETPVVTPRATCFAILTLPPSLFPQRVHPKNYGFVYAMKNHRWNQKFSLVE